LQKRTQIQWDIGAALGTGNGADESTSPQAGITPALQQLITEARHAIVTCRCSIAPQYD